MLIYFHYVHVHNHGVTRTFIQLQKINMHNSVMFAINLLGCKCFRHLCHQIYAAISVCDIYAKISVNEIKIGTFECSFSPQSPNNVYERELRTSANYNHTNTGKTKGSSCKIGYFCKRVHNISAKITLVSCG